MAGRFLRVRNPRVRDLEPRWGGGLLAKVNLACEVTIRKTTTDAVAFFEAALAEVEALLGITWIEDLIDPETGEIAKLRIVTDNGPCFKSGRFAAWVASKRHIVHIRTRKNAHGPTG